EPGELARGEVARRGSEPGTGILRGVGSQFSKARLLPSLTNSGEKGVRGRVCFNQPGAQATGLGRVPSLSLQAGMDVDVVSSSFGFAAAPFPEADGGRGRFRRLARRSPRRIAGIPSRT